MRENERERTNEREWERERDKDVTWRVMSLSLSLPLFFPLSPSLSPFLSLSLPFFLRFLSVSIKTCEGDTMTTHTATLVSTRCNTLQHTQHCICALFRYLRKENRGAMPNSDFSCGRNTFFFGNRHCAAVLFLQVKKSKKA